MTRSTSTAKARAFRKLARLLQNVMDEEAREKEGLAQADWDRHQKETRELITRIDSRQLKRRKK